MFDIRFKHSQRRFLHFQLNAAYKSLIRNSPENSLILQPHYICSRMLAFVKHRFMWMHVNMCMHYCMGFLMYNESLINPPPHPLTVPHQKIYMR